MVNRTLPAVTADESGPAPSVWRGRTRHLFRYQNAPSSINSVSHRLQHQQSRVQVQIAQYRVLSVKPRTRASAEWSSAMSIGHITLGSISHLQLAHPGKLIPEDFKQLYSISEEEKERLGFRTETNSGRKGKEKATGSNSSTKSSVKRKGNAEDGDGGGGKRKRK